MPFFSVALGPTSPNMNANSRRRSTIPGSAERYCETSYRQTPEEHQALLDQFKGVKGLPPDVAEALGREAEAKSPRYWDGDAVPRYGGSTPSSSFITGINVNPGIGLATIQMKNGRSYSYPITADQAGELLNANSIGAAYNKLVKLGHSNIPVEITSRSGARSGPSQFRTDLGRSSRNFAAAPDSGINALSAIIGPAAAIGILSGLAKLAENREDLEEES